MIDPYKVLGVTYDASDEEIKTSFRKLVKETHPDLNGNDTKLTDKFIEIAEAYTILSDQEQKERYDLFNKKKKQKQDENDCSYENSHSERDVASEIKYYINLLMFEIN